MKNVALTLLLVLSSVVALDVATAAAAPAKSSTLARLRYVAPTKKPTPGGKVSINPQPLPPRYFIKK